jgi:hypothetical protein
MDESTAPSPATQHLYLVTHLHAWATAGMLTPRPSHDSIRNDPTECGTAYARVDRRDD